MTVGSNIVRKGSGTTVNPRSQSSVTSKPGHSPAYDEGGVGLVASTLASTTGPSPVEEWVLDLTSSCRQYVHDLWPRRESVDDAKRAGGLGIGSSIDAVSCRRQNPSLLGQARVREEHVSWSIVIFLSSRLPLRSRQV